MKLKNLKTLMEASSKSINDTILNNNLKATFGEKSRKVVNANSDQELAKGDPAVKKLPKKNRNGGDRVVFGESNIIEKASLYDPAHKSEWISTAKDAGATAFIKDEKANRLNAYSDSEDRIIGHWDFSVNKGIIYNNEPANILEDEELEMPDIDSNKQKIKARTQLNPTLLITREGNEGQKANVLKGKYSDFDKLKRIFRNFYNLILSDSVEGKKPKIMKYTETSLQAAVDGKDGEYVITIKDLPGFSAVKDFNQFLKSELR